MLKFPEIVKNLEKIPKSSKDLEMYLKDKCFIKKYWFSLLILLLSYYIIIVICYHFNML